MFSGKRYSPKRVAKSGFTLIELLIVVAIIAILAAIAVPNFLEAQVRAKVSRVKADQRTLATAIESYAVDNNRAPIGIHEIQKFFPYRTILGQLYPATAASTYWALTTPISYLTSVPKDPFALVDHRRPSKLLETDHLMYAYQTYFAREGVKVKPYNKAYRNGFTWSVDSGGPMRHFMYGLPYIQTILNHASYKASGEPTSNGINGIYDSTNGTISWGRIFRTNKGINVIGSPDA